jgi:hypothetical protein
VVAGAGDPGPGLQVLQRGAIGPVQRLLECLLPPGPVRGRLLVVAQAGPALVSRMEACSTEMDLENEMVTS